MGSKAQSKPQPKPGFPHVQSNITLTPLHWGNVVVVVDVLVVVMLVVVLDGQGFGEQVPPPWAIPP